MFISDSTTNITLSCRGVRAKYVNRAADREGRASAPVSDRILKSRKAVFGKMEKSSRSAPWIKMKIQTEVECFSSASDIERTSVNVNFMKRRPTVKL